MCINKYLLLLMHSDVVVNYIVPRLFFAGVIGDIQRLQVQYVPGCKVPNEREKGKFWREFVNCYWDLNQIIRLQNNP